LISRIERNQREIGKELKEEGSGIPESLNRNPRFGYYPSQERERLGNWQNPSVGGEDDRGKNRGAAGQGGKISLIE
jgi:hypothetical protein